MAEGTISLEPAALESRFDFKVIFALLLIHFIGDFYMSFINPLLPVLAEKLSLSMTRLGLVTGTSMLMAFIVQPSVGYLSDRYRTRFFILGGPLLSAIFIPLFGWAAGFSSLIIFTALGSIGQSLFHPPAAGMVPNYAGRRQGFSMALFILGGTIAFGVGPVFVTWYVTRFGLSALPWISLLGVAFMLIMLILVPKPEGEGLKALGLIGSIRDALGPMWKPLTVIWLIIVVRTFVIQSTMTFVPVYFSRQGYPLVSIGAILSTFVIAGSISGLVAGYLADRIGYKPVFYTTYILASPCLYLFLNLKGNWVFLGSFLAGFFTLATLALATAMAQTFVQRGKSLVASLTMGLAFGTGGILTPLTGKMADTYSIHMVLSVVIWVPLVAAVLIRYLPNPSQLRTRK
ncbi:MAG: MFS transporter [Pseudomonadota bacterium]